MRAQLAALLAELAPGDLNGDETADGGLHETGAEVEFGSDQERPVFLGETTPLTLDCSCKCFVC